MNLKLAGLVLAVGLAPALAGPAQAQSYSTSHQRFASLAPYSNELWQVRIRAVTTHTLLLYGLTERRYELGQAKLTALGRRDQEDTDGRFVGMGGQYELRYRELEMGSPALYEIGSGYISALQSILRRSEAGEQFSPAEADRFLREAQAHLLVMNLHLAQRERATQRLVARYRPPASIVVQPARNRLRATMRQYLDDEPTSNAWRVPDSLR
jgi:hypothetical protein